MVFHSSQNENQNTASYQTNFPVAWLLPTSPASSYIIAFSRAGNLYFPPSYLVCTFSPQGLCTCPSLSPWKLATHFCLFNQYSSFRSQPKCLLVQEAFPGIPAQMPYYIFSRICTIPFRCHLLVSSTSCEVYEHGWFCTVFFPSDYHSQ